MIIELYRSYLISLQKEFVWSSAQEKYKLMFIRELSADEVILLEDKLENIEYIKKFLPNVEAYLVKGGNW